LYHGRLDKSPGALALRLRWYGAAEPNIVFVERKTHRDKWIGEVSVKERFMVSIVLLCYYWCVPNHPNYKMFLVKRSKKKRSSKC
jgi:SPX domain protein involved in polyphosphate accumulation